MKNRRSNKKINITKSEKLQNEVINKLSEDKEIQSNNFQESDTSSENNQLSSNDDSSKNLANFFNGEIIDLEE